MWLVLWEHKQNMNVKSSITNKYLAHSIQIQQQNAQQIEIDSWFSNKNNYIMALIVHGCVARFIQNIPNSQVPNDMKTNFNISLTICVRLCIM